MISKTLIIASVMAVALSACNKNEEPAKPASPAPQTSEPTPMMPAPAAPETSSNVPPAPPPALGPSENAGHTMPPSNGS